MPSGSRLRPRVHPGGASRHKASTIRAAAAGALLALGAGIGAPTLSPAPVGAASVTTLRARAARIARKIDTIQTKLQILSEEYDQARNRAAATARSIRAAKTSLAGARREVSADATRLRKEAVEAYVTAGTGSGLVLSGSANALPLRQTYLDVASNGLHAAITSLHDSEHRLHVRGLTLAKQERRAEQAAQVIDASRRHARHLLAQLGGTEASLKGSLAVAVKAQEAAQQAAAAAAAAATARQAAAAQPPAAPTGSTGSTGSSPPAAPQPPVTGAGNGAAAVAAARTQLGVPYVWGGATPGAGFDCSGLTMWAWGQAGVNLPHSAQAQYDDIEHVSLSQLQPGDLIFYASGGYIYHVIMYIGGGEAIQAETTGTVVSITPVWPGAYGAGRP